MGMDWLTRRCKAASSVMILIASVTLATSSAALYAGDWPQVLGPHRTAIADGETLLDTVPKAGPKIVWERPVGSGYAGVAVQGPTAILYHRVDDNEVVEALDIDTGKARWQVQFPTQFSSGVGDNSGPRCVPIIHQGAIYVCGPQGTLHALGLKDGANLWTRAAFKDYNAPEGYFGAGSTPLIEGDKLLLNVGGRNGAGIVAFSLKTGKTVWKATDEAASYSSPIAVTQKDLRHVIFVTRLNTLSIDPENGQVRWKFRFGQTGPTVNAATPIVSGDRLFVTASYGIGSALMKFDADSIEKVWANDDSLSSQFTTPVLKDGMLYGIDGRQDVGRASLRCIELETGKIRWSVEGFGKAELILAGDRLLIQKTDGTVLAGHADPAAWKELWSASVLASTAIPLPALSNGRLYLRDENTLKCVEVGKRTSK